MKRMNLTQQAFTIALAMVMMILTWAEADAQAYQLIIGHPRDVVVEEGQVDTVTFTVEAVPGTPVTYQWFMQAPAQALPDPVKEAISPVLEMSAKEAYGLDGYRFFCEVTFEMLIENSLPAYITASLPRVMILKHPQDVIEAEGFTGDVAYGVDLIPGIEPKIYWYIRLPGKNWEEYSTGQQMVFPVKEPLDEKLLGTAFRCLVDDAKYGKEISNTAYLWIKQTKKYIVNEPVDVTKKEGFVGEIYFNIKTEGLDLTYQWQLQRPGEEWRDLSEGTKPEYIFPVKDPLTLKMNGWAFRCVVADKTGYSEFSEPAYLHVEQGLKYILAHPEDVMVKQGFTGPVYYAIKFDDGGFKLKFQWQIKEPKSEFWKDISGATAPDLRYTILIPILPESSGTAFRCVVSDELGYIEYSNEGYLYVSLYETYFTSHPKNVGRCEGYVGSIKFSISVIPYVTLSYQWQVKYAGGSIWTDIPGANTTLYVLESDGLPLSFNGNQYRCKVVDSHGGTEFSNVAFLYVYAKPAIVSHPVSQTKLLGEGVTFNVAASGYKPLTYQWLQDDVPLLGTNSPSYTKYPVEVSDGGTYRCQVTNTCDPSGALSKAATLTVEVPKYTDGWFEQDIVTSKDLLDIKFAGEYSGWVSIEDNPNIYKTIDGGDNWTAVPLGSNQDWNAVFATDDDHVWVAGGPKIKYSTNAGTDWSSFSIYNLGLVADSVLYDLFFVSNDTGWAVGDNGLIIKTTNGGSAWSIQNSIDFPPFVSDAHLEAAHFLDKNNGWVVGDQGVILVTTNGGTGWAMQASGVIENNLNDVFFVDSDNGWAVGDNHIATDRGVVLKTTNGGTNWSLITTNPSVTDQDITGVHFADLLNGWIITSDGKIYRTNDGGVTWYSQETGTSNALNAIDFADYNNGWVVGDVHTILRTAYSGCLLPTVNLFEDKQFCASISYELMADTFAKNVDCSYLWNTAETSGSIAVDTSGIYYVTVTSLCGENVSDTVTINFFPLPDAYAGADAELCDGDSIQFLAIGGVNYSWNNEAYLDDPDIQNPKAGPPLGTTDFVVTVTDDNECQNTDTIAVTVHPIPTSIFTSPEFVCGDWQATITYTGSATDNANFYWDFDTKSTVHSGDSVGPYQVSWDTLAIRTLSLVVEENGCSSDTTFESLSVNVIPTSDFTVLANVCGDETVTVTYSGNATAGANYNWNFGGATEISGTGQGPYEITWATKGNKLISLGVTENNCSSVATEKSLSVVYPFEGEEICLVTVDLETRLNMVIWEKTKNVGIHSYNIYRESATGGEYDLIGNSLFDQLSVFVDVTSEPEKKSHKYRISIVDTCGNESSPSLYHKTMLLTSNLGPGRINLSWQEYEKEGGAFGFVKYLIYRGESPGELEILDSIASGNVLYPDINPPSDTMYYRIAGVLDGECAPAVLIGKKAGAGPYSHSVSNIEENRLQTTGLNDQIREQYQLNVYPNPFSQVTQLTYRLTDVTDVKIEVYNLLGARIFEMVRELQSPGEYSYDIRAADIGSTEGIFYIRFTVDDKSMVKKVILAR